MIKVSDILKKYNIDKSVFLGLLKKHTGKVYSEKTRVIGEKTFELVEKELFNYKEKNKDSGKEKNKDSGKEKNKDSGKEKNKDSGKEKNKDSGKEKNKDSGKEKNKDSGKEKNKDSGKEKNKDSGKEKKQIVEKKTKASVKKKKKTDDEKKHKSVTSNDIMGMDFLANTLGIKKTSQQVKKTSNINKIEKDIKKEENLKEENKKEENVKEENKKEENTKEENKKDFTFKVQKRSDLDQKKKQEQKSFQDKSNQKSGNNFKVQKKSDKKEKINKRFNNKKNILEKQKENKPKISDTLKKKDKITMGDHITIKELSERVGISIGDIIKQFVLNGMPVGINSTVDFDTVALISDDLGVKVEKENVSSDINSMFEGNLSDILKEKHKIKDNLEERSPIVTIMGHVDHGKTKLLDYMRKTDVVGKEFGSITQSIGASSILYNGKHITFIDTPGHELFTSMRARGAKITDIAVIVVAGDEGVKKQTIEAVDHAKDAGVSIMIAITKIDKKNINIDLVKSQLSEHGVLSEDWGGDVPFVCLSSMTGEGVDSLLEYINLQSEMLELKYNPKVPSVGVVLEASKDSKVGTISTLLPITGVLENKDSIVAYDVYGKMKLMKDWTGKVVKSVKAGEPVQVMGFEGVPESGRIFEVFENDKEAQKQVSKIQQMIKDNENQNTLSRVLERIQSGENVELKVILKAGDFGGLEALKYSVGKVNLPEGVDLKIIHEEVGQVKETDISLAEAGGAFIFGFDSSIDSSLKKKLEQRKIVFKNFTIIYELLDYIEKLAAGMVKKEVKEVKIGEFEMKVMFYKKGNDMIIGGKIIDGSIKNGLHFTIRRGDEELGGGKITSLKIGQENVNEAKAPRECGIRVRTGKRFKEGDILDIYLYE